MTETIERKVLELIAQDRIEAPLSSLYQMTKRRKLASALNIGQDVSEAHYQGERVFAYSEQEDIQKARKMKEAVAEFCVEFPKYGAILNGKIAEKRTRSETHLYFGTNPGAKLTADDYLDVMQSLGLSETTSRSLYPDLVQISRKLRKKRDEGTRSILIGKADDEAEELD